MTSRRDEIRYTQNFLHSPALVERLVALAKLPRGGTVLEIGPGKGIITRQLLAAVGDNGVVIAVELDETLVERLKTQFRDKIKLRIVNNNILEFDLTGLPHGYSVFANVPFNITSALLEMLFHPTDGPAQAHLILQRDTLIAASEYGDGETFKSMLIRPLYDIDIAYTFRRSDFTPQPSVETALFAFQRRETPLVDPAQYELYKDFLAAISKDRAGEGVWNKLFSRVQMNTLADMSGLISGRGLKSQSVRSVVNAFALFAQQGRAKWAIVKGAMAVLRVEQQRREQINRAGGHRRQS